MQPEQLLDVFRKNLETLKENDKYRINELTIFARDHKDFESVANGIVEVTMKHLQSIRDEKGRLKLYNLRTTWKDIFPNSRMYELDIRVREHDPAWPLLASQPESKAAFRSLPNIPKIQVKAESKEDLTATDKSAESAEKSSITVSRDPRLNRKRKIPTAAVVAVDSPTDEFLIDRSGDQKMESVARKQGKQEEASEQPKKLTLFGGQDLDMRAQIPPSPSAKSGVWSNYIDKHAEVRTRREVKDVDMRFVGSVTGTELPEVPNDLPICTNAPEVMPPHLPPGVDSLAIPMFVPPPQNVPPPRPPVAFINPPVFMHPSAQDPRVMGPPPITNIPPPPLPPPEFHTRPPPPRFDEDWNRKLIPLAPQSFNLPNHQTQGPPIRGPPWRVEIYGFPDMINIGVDPRMLSLMQHPKPPRRITIDGQRYSLLLDRIQPLIAVGEQLHAVRFRCDRATVLINGRCFTIPGTGFTKIMIGWRPYQAYLGGPGHELVIDGRPHTIPLGAPLTFITVGNNSVGVKFVGDPPRNVNVLPPIPSRLLKWSGQGLFGSPRHLHRPPLNPLVELARLADGRPAITDRPPMPNEVQQESPHRPDLEEMNGSQRFVDMPQPVPTTQANITIPVDEPNGNVEEIATVEKPSALSVSEPQIDVHALFQKLVKAGIVADTAPQPPPEIVSYNWDRFKLPCSPEISELYEGHQCGQCGLRFHSDSSTEFASHLDYHYMKNSFDDQGRHSRNFYQAARYWLLSEMVHDGAAQFDTGPAVPDLQESKCQAFEDPAKNICAVCYEKFDVFWDHDEEEWMLRDAVLLQDNVYHPICQEDAGKEFSVNSEIAHDMREVLPPLSELKDEVPLSPSKSKPSPEAASPGDDDTFVCDEQKQQELPMEQHEPETPQEQTEEKKEEEETQMVEEKKSNDEEEKAETDDDEPPAPEEFSHIPGLSPIADDMNEEPESSPIAPDVKTDDEPTPSKMAKMDESPVEEYTIPSLKPESIERIPIHEHISADPLAALKAVLHGGMSSLIQPPSNS